LFYLSDFFNTAEIEMFANALENWLTVVAALSIFGSLQAYLSTNTLKDRQFSLAKNEGFTPSPLRRCSSLCRLQTRKNLFNFIFSSI
jgi:hypothetical protein